MSEIVPIVGTHVRKINNFTTTLKKWCGQIHTAQIFLSSPRRYYESRTFDPEDLNEARKLLEEYDLPLFIHAAYLYNLHGTVSVDGEKYKINRRRSINAVKNELDMCVGLGAEGAVIHTAAAKIGCQAACSRVADSINLILTENSNFTNLVAEMLEITTNEVKKRRCLILENCAGQGSQLGKDLDELKMLIDGVREDLRDQVTVCLDTCHLFAAGCYDLRKVEEVERLFREADEKLGNHLHVIHLNDSKIKFGGHTDRHHHIKHGEVWKDNEEPLKLLIKLATERYIPLILEAPDDKKDEDKIDEDKIDEDKIDELAWLLNFKI